MRRVAVAVVLLAVLLAVVVAVGRWERERWVDGESARMQEVVDTIGPSLLVSTLTDYYDEREGLRAKCLRYWYGGDPYALQLCFDSHGRLVETADERSGKVEISDLRVERGRSPVTVPVEEVERVRGLVRARQLEIRRERKRAAAQAQADAQSP